MRSAGSEAFPPREPQGQETSQLAGPKVCVAKKNEEIVLSHVLGYQAA